MKGQRKCKLLDTTGFMGLDNAVNMSVFDGKDLDTVA